MGIDNVDKHNVWSRRSIYSFAPTLIKYNRNKRRPFPGSYSIHTKPHCGLSIDSFKRPCVRKTRIPDLINHLRCLRLIFTGWSAHYRFDGSRPHTILMLLRNRPIIPCKEFSRPPTFSAQTRCSNLTQRVSGTLFRSRDCVNTTSVHAACLKSAQSTFHLKWSQACTIS